MSTARKVKCPTCKAAAGQMCVNPHGAQVPDHGARAIAAQKLDRRAADLAAEVADALTPRSLWP